MVMTNTEFVNKVKDIAKNYKTLYVMGCFGAPLTAASKKRYIDHHSYNQKSARKKAINAATADTFGFDCVCLIKAVLWGWNGDPTRIYGGAAYATNGVPDIGADTMITKCSDLSTDFSKIEIGEAVWTDGHIGVYIGNGLAVECTPKWADGVQITACNRSVSGYNRRNWKKHGKLPYIKYEAQKAAETETEPTTVKLDSAKSFSKEYAKQYTVSASSLNMRSGAGTNKAIITTLKNGTKFMCYGYYTKQADGTVWLYGVADGKTGFCSKAYLK